MQWLWNRSYKLGILEKQNSIAMKHNCKTVMIQCIMQSNEDFTTLIQCTLKSALCNPYVPCFAQCKILYGRVA